MTDMKRAFDLIDAFAEQHIQSAGIPGIALGVTDRERTLHISTVGFADVASRRPVAPETLFEIGSISKSFTSLTLMQLHEAGRLDLHAPVVQYLPWFQVPSKHGPITPHHLMSHTGGIIMGTDFTGETRHEVWALRETEATAPPGTFFHYSNVGYKALGLMLEEILDQPYGEIIRERVLGPLGMTGSEPEVTHDTRLRLAVGYESLYDDRPTHPSQPLVPATWVEYAGGDGSIAASITDMASYLRLLLNCGKGPEGPLISRESFRLMTRPITESSDSQEEFFYGYGLVIGRQDDHPIIGHDGGMIGYYSAALCDTEAGLGVAVLINGPGEPWDIADFVLRAVRHAVRGQELPPLPPAPGHAAVSNAADYAGTYHSVDNGFQLRAADERLLMDYLGQKVVLEPQGRERFYAPHPDLGLFLLHFEREGDRVVAACHGPDWYAKDGYRGADQPEPPPDWETYAGHYRSHNPWYTNFRVVLRRGHLVLIQPRGEEHPLTPLDGPLFRVGADDRSPERIRFGTPIDGQVSSASFSGCQYYRTFTP